MSTRAGEFMPINAEQRLVKLHPNVHKLRPGVVRRTHPAEPDRTHVDKAAELNPQPLPEPKAPDVAARKQRASVNAETRAVAVSRVEKLIAAGNPSAEAHATVAKELGVSESAIQNWRTKARKAKKNGAPTRGKARIEAQIAEHVKGSAELGPLDIALDLLELASRAASVLSPASRKRLRQELDRRLS